MSVLSWLKGAIQSLFSREDLASRMQITLPTDKSMEEAIKLWSECYHDTAPWLIEDTDLKSLNLAFSVSHEIARLVTLEFKSEISGSKRADALSDTYSRTVSDSPLWVEHAAALGGVFLKPYITDGGIVTDYVQADAAFVTAYSSSGDITGAIFVDRMTRGEKIYTKLEHHDHKGSTHTVINRAFVSDQSTYLGREIPLESVPEWAGIAPSAEFKGTPRPLFVYMRMPGVNTVDRRSPLGMSVFNAALRTIEDADRQYTRMNWEFEGSELAVYASVTAIRRDSSGRESVPKYNRRLIKTLEFDDDNAFNVFSPAIRDQSLINGLNSILRKVELQCSLAFGTISDVNDVDKTATEVKASKQRSYSTVKAIQGAVEKALREYAEVLDILATIAGMPTGTIEQSFEFDDSLVTDTESEQKIWLQEVSAGLMSPAEYRMRRYGETEEQAAEKLPGAFEGDA